MGKDKTPLRSRVFGKFFQDEIRKVYVKGYGDAGASYKKRALRAFVAQSGAPSEDIDFHNKTLRQRGRMLYMASPVATAAINTNRTKVVGSGLHMRCAINREILGLSEEAAAEWENQVEAEWQMWATKRSNCDSMGMNNFYELQQLAIKSWLMSGDIFALMKRTDPTPTNPYTLRIQLVEADRISTPTELKVGSLYSVTEGTALNGNKIYDGVEVDKDGRVVAYHICNVYPSQVYAEAPKWTRVEARGKLTGIPNILQVMDAERPGQYRGVSYLAPIIEILLQVRRYTESELTAALVQSYLTAWITTETDPSDFPFNETGDGVDSPTSNISDNENEYEMGPGTINHLAPGESVTLGNPNIPTSGFESFVKTIIKMSGASLELPYDVLMKEFNSSYSAAKGALEEAWEAFKMRRSWFIADFCQPIYEIWLAEAVATGRIKAPGFFGNPLIREAWCGAQWDGPAQTHLDPTKEAQANEMLVSHGWKTNEQITREFYGGDWAKNIATLSAEGKLAKQLTGATEPPKKEPPEDDPEEDPEETPIEAEEEETDE